VTSVRVKHFPGSPHGIDEKGLDLRHFPSGQIGQLVHVMKNHRRHGDADQAVILDFIAIDLDLCRFDYAHDPHRDHTSSALRFLGHNQHVDWVSVFA
jgi:hypothetical protein